MSRMRVLFFHRANDYTGSTRALCNVIEDSYGNSQVQVVTTNAKDDGLLKNMPNVHLVNVFYPKLFGAKIKVVSYLIATIHVFLIALFKGWSYDVFYINTITPYPAVLAGWLLRKKIIYHVHEKFVAQTLEIRLQEYLFNHTQGSHYFVSEYLKSQYPSLKGQSNVKYNKLSASFLAAVRVKPAHEHERKNIIMISSLSEAKGVRLFVDLARVLPEYSFTLVLSANDKQIEDFFGRVHLANLSLVSAQSNIHQFLEHSDLLLNLSNPYKWIETFGLTILEAMAYGIPAIVPNIGGPTELIVHDYNGYCIDVTNLEKVRETIKQCLEKQNYVRLSNNANERFKSFS